MFEQGLRNHDGPCGTTRVAILSDSLACMLVTTTTPGNLVRINVEVHWTIADLVVAGRGLHALAAAVSAVSSICSIIGYAGIAALCPTVRRR
jgi:hypothetical protein